MAGGMLGEGLKNPTEKVSNLLEMVYDIVDNDNVRFYTRAFFSTDSWDFVNFDDALPHETIEAWITDARNPTLDDLVTMLDTVPASSAPSAADAARMIRDTAAMEDARAAPVPRGKRDARHRKK